MEHKLYPPSLFIAQLKPLSNVVTLQKSFPLEKLQRQEISFLQQSLKIPVYPDQTNFGQENTRAQLRYSVFPIMEDLGFESFGQQLEKLFTLQQKTQRLVPIEKQITLGYNNTCSQTVKMTIKGHLKFELPGTRTQNCPVKSRELYH